MDQSKAKAAKETGQATCKVDGKEVTIVEREEDHQRKVENQGGVILRGHEHLPHLVVDEVVAGDSRCGPWESS